MATDETESWTKVHFRITGPAITKIARDLVLDGEWVKGARLLKNGIIGFTWDYAFRVLSGTHKLVGNETDGLNLEKDRGSRRYRNQQQQLYGNIILEPISHEYMRPYGIVSAWCERDLAWPRENRFCQGSRLTALGFLVSPEQSTFFRSLYYARDGRNDLPVVVDYNGRTVCALFGRTKQLPLWLEPCPTPQEAIKRTHWLPELSWEIPRTESALLPSGVFGKPDTPADAKLDPFGGLSDVLATASSVTPDAIQGVMQAVAGEQDWESEPIIDRKKLSKYGWISPSGDFFGCTLYMEHKALAARILKHRIFTDPTDDPDKLLESKGWAKVSISPLTGEASAWIYGSATPNQQLSIAEWGIAQGLVVGTTEFTKG